MKTEDFKAALIYALNFDQADLLLDTICRCCECYESGGLAELEKALFRLRVDTKSIIRIWQKNQQYLKQYRAESAAQTREEEVQEVYEDRIMKGKFTDEEDVIAASSQRALRIWHERASTN